MSHRATVLGEQVRQILSNALLFDMRDEDLEGVTITRVRVSPDLGYADVRFTYPDEEISAKRVLEACFRAKGALKHRLADNLNLRRVPELRFHVDEDINAERRIGEILDDLDIPTDAE